MTIAVDSGRKAKNKQTNKISTMFLHFCIVLTNKNENEKNISLYTKLQPSNMTLGVNSDNLMHTFVGKSV